MSRRDNYFNPKTAGLALGYANLASKIYGYARPRASSAYYKQRSTLVKPKSGYSKTAPNSAPAQTLPQPSKKRRRRKPITKKGKTLRTMKSQIRSLQQSERQSLGQMTARNIYSQRVLASANQQQIATISNPLSTTTIENALGNLKFFDPANPGTLVTASMAVGSYQRNVLFKSVTSKLLVRNNYQTDVNVKVYLAQIKDDTNFDISSAWVNAVADGSNMVGTTELGQYPSDYNQVNDLYKVSMLSKASLSPGQSMTCSHTVKDIEYDSSTVDSHGLIYQREYKSFQFLLVITGQLGHDTVSDQQTHLEAGVDCQVLDTYVVKYDAGINITYTHVNNYMDSAFTNLGVQSHQPTPDNIAFSIA